MLLACPFCRELFEPRERTACAVCGVALVPLDRLPPSLDAQAEDGIPHQPEHDSLGLAYLGRGRGPLVVLGLAGLAAFLAPWIHVTLPDVITFSGFALARRLGWSWAAGVAWFVLVPTVLSRRSIAQMRGARVATAFLAAVPGLTAAILIGRPPHGSRLVPLHFEFGEGLYATITLSVVALAFALFFGGRLDAISVRTGSSAGRVVH